MAEQYSSEQFLYELNSKIRDAEEKQRILRDRIILIGKGLIEEREKSFSEIQEMKKIIITLTEENRKMKEFMQGVSQQLSQTARKDDFLILQRQLDLLRKTKE